MKLSELIETDVSKLTKIESTVLAGKLIADAIDRQTELQKKNIKIQMQMDGLAEEMFEGMKKQLDNLDEGDEWKKNLDTD